MRQLYIGDTPVIKIHVGQDVTGYELKIIYKKPNGDTGEWSALADECDIRSINYACNYEDLDETGSWMFQGQLRNEETGEQYTSDVVVAEVMAQINMIKEANERPATGLIRHAHISGSSR